MFPNYLSGSDTRIFKAVMLDGIKVENKADKLKNSGLRINAILDRRTAVVSTDASRLESLMEDVEKYSDDGTKKTNLQFIDRFESYEGIEKESESLRKKRAMVGQDEPLDVELMLLPKLSENDYEIALNNMINEIMIAGGRIEEGPFRLSNAIPIMRVTALSSQVERLETDPVVYRITETSFFEPGPVDNTLLNNEDIMLDSDVGMESLPIVTIMDSGINLPRGLSGLIEDRWSPDGYTVSDDHGTCVAGRTIFGFTEGNILRPRARLIDCQIVKDGSSMISTTKLIDVVQKVVKRYHAVSKLFNFSINETFPTNISSMSPMGSEFDTLQKKYGIQFIISSGNHNIWKEKPSLKEILTDPAARIAAPADSIFGITVGSVVGETHSDCISERGQVAPYSRIGPGFRELIKPDISAMSATICNHPDGKYDTPEDKFSKLISSRGRVIGVGTSYSAPVVAGDLAEIKHAFPEEDILTIKGLLLHGAAQSLQDTSQINAIGRGISSPELSIYSNQTRVTFVRKGILKKNIMETVPIYIPRALAEMKGNNRLKITITCLSRPELDIGNHHEYITSYVETIMEKRSYNDVLTLMHLPTDCRKKWDPCQQASVYCSRFQHGEWMLTLKLRTRDEKDAEVQYVAIVTIEDMSQSLNLHDEIKLRGTYHEMNMVDMNLLKIQQSKTDKITIRGRPG